MSTRYGAIIVTYNPDVEFLKKNVESLIASDSISDIIIVDNSIESENNCNNINAEYISLGSNKGIAYAQNIGIGNLVKKGVDYTFFFDQDTLIDIELIESVIKTYKKIITKDESIKVLSPRYIDKETKISSRKIKEFEKVEECISSCSLVDISVFNEVGMFEEKLFIDFVDFEFCWRIQNHGYSIYRANCLYLKHPVGKKVFSLFGKNIYIPSPFRHYYVYRNGKILKERDYVPKKWKKRELVLDILMPFIIILFLDNKLERLRYIKKGIKDAKTY